LATLITALYRRLRRHRCPSLVAAGAAIALCLLFSFRVTVREDIRALLPSGFPALTECFSFLNNAPFMHAVAVTVGGPKTDAAPEALADSLADALRGPDIPYAATGPRTSFSPSELADFCFLAPALLGPDRTTAFAESLSPEGIRLALAKDALQLTGPGGLAFRDLVCLDPLRVHVLLFKKLASLGGPGGFSTRDGYFVDASGRYAMVLLKPQAPMTDTLAARAVMTRIRQAAADLPEGAESFVTGSYRHSDDNARTIKEDLGRVLPVSLVLVGTLILLFIRRRQALGLIAVPVAAVSFASAATAALYGSVSGIVLGFGSVLLGITADYSIHTYFSITDSENVEQGLARLTTPLLTGAGTTAAAFAALFFSDIPAIRQVALFGLFGIAVALFVSLLILPLLLTGKSPSEKKIARTPYTCGINAPRQSAPEQAVSPCIRALLPLCAFFALVIGAAFYSLPFDGDIRNLSHVSEETLKDEETARSIWQNGRDNALIVAAADGSDAGFEQALSINDRIADLLDAEGASSSGIAGLLPSRVRQRENIAAWQNLWAKQAAATLAELAIAATQTGFSPSAFAPFADWIASKPAPVTPERLRALGAGMLLDMFVFRNEERSLIYTILPQGYKPEITLVRRIEEAGGHLVSGAAFRDAMAATAGADILRVCLLTLFTTCAAVLLLSRSLPQGLAVLLPTLSGLAFTLTLLHLCGFAMNMFHAVALPLVIALSVDYGIFVQAVLEGRLEAAGKKGVALSALTTLAGFGSLLLARHPALFSLGISVSGGIAAALATALWLQPALMKKHSLHPAGK
jgi:predicted exporter